MFFGLHIDIKNNMQYGPGDNHAIITINNRKNKFTGDGNEVRKNSHKIDEQIFVIRRRYNGKEGEEYCISTSIKEIVPH